MLVPIEFPPGISRNGTQYQTQGRYYDCNLVRWFGGVPQPIGGWGRTSVSAFATKCRTLMPWRTNGGGRYLAIGLSNALKVSRGDATFYDITPIGFTAGADDPTEAVGYGSGAYGFGTYGTPRAGGSFNPLTVWHFDTWGEYLVACMRGDGKLYEWTLDTGTKAATITNAPTGCHGVLVSEQRHLIALCPGGNVRKVQWSDKENNTVWTPSDTNEAGSYELQTAGAIQCGRRVRGEVLILTSEDAHALRYSGQPFIFGRDRVGNDCGIISPNAVVATESFAVWMGGKGFFIYEGSNVKPLPCEVSEYVFGDLNTTAREKIVAGHNGQFGEIWWFYPSSAATEPDRYVAYNYRDRFWIIGQLARTSWCDKGVFSHPFAMGSDNHLYSHEDGDLDNGASRVASMYLESGVFEHEYGDRVVDVNQVLPDEKTRGDLQVSFRTRFTPNGDEYSYGPYTVRDDGYIDARFSGRQIVMRLEPTADRSWRFGRFRLDGVIGGNR
jgi:hypothetical protein